MGIVSSKCCTDSPMQLKARIQLLEEEIKEMMRSSREERTAFEWKRDVRVMMRHVEGQHWLGNEYLVEHMKEEQAKREVAAEKWKHLYLTIKAELDNLIHRTTRQAGGRVFFGAEEGMIEGLRRELKAKEETVEALRFRISEMEKEGVRREREIDILRQSLRILSNTKKNGMRRNLRRRLIS